MAEICASGATRTIQTPRTAIVLLLVSLIAVQGCSSTGRPVAVAISSDNSTTGYIWETRLTELRVDGRTWRSDFDLDIVDVRSLQKTRSVYLGSIGVEAAGDTQHFARVHFAPDSRHVAVLVGRKIWVVHLASGRRTLWTAPAERATSCSWIDAAQFAYGTVAKQPSGDPKFRRSLWLARVDGSPANRQQVYSTPADGWGGFSEFQQDYWSPDGRHAVTIDGDAVPRMVLVHVPSGRVVPLGRPEISACSAAWTSDSRLVFCLGPITGDGMQALLVSVDPLKVHDRTDRAGIFVKVSGLPFSWTHDNKYVIDHLMGRLIEPFSWQVFDTASNLKQSLGISQPGLPVLFALPTPTGVGAVACSASAKPTRIVYATSHDGRRWQALATNVDAGHWAVSPDGSLITTIWRERKVLLHGLALNKGEATGR